MIKENIKINLLAYSSNTGLGYQTLEFAKNIKCNRILIADLSQYNKMPTHHERFIGLCNELKIYDGIPDDKTMEWLADDANIVFVCETPLNYNLFTICRNKKIKSVMQYNYEFLNYFRDENLPKPDVLASPSYWYLGEVISAKFAKVEYLPVPIDTKNIKPRDIKQIKTITHVGGRPAQHDRNGTIEFINFALTTHNQYHYKKINYQVFIQISEEAGSNEVYQQLKPLINRAEKEIKGRIEFIFNTENYLDMYKQADLIIIPRKYGGLCLPLWEGLAHGIPVLMPNISPNNIILPKDWLFEAHKYDYLVTHSKIPMYKTNIENIIEKVNNLILDNNYYKQSIRARNLANEMSWGNMTKKYYKLFYELTNETEDNFIL